MKTIFLLAVTFIVLIAKVQAAETILGWTNIQDCTRAVDSGSSIFSGIIPDTIESTEQRMDVVLLYNDLSQLQSYQESVIKYCAQTAAYVAGFACLVSNLTACAPAFWTSFSSCVANYSVNSDDLGLALQIKSECVGW